MLERLKASTCVHMKHCLLPLVFATLCAPLHARSWFDGGDLSALSQIEHLGCVFLDSEGKPTTAMKSLAANGANCVRLRLFVEPNGEGFVTNDLESTLALAKRAQESGQAVLLDFHYSDTWADPGKQFLPASWEKLSVPELNVRLETYTFETLKAFEHKGVMPELVQIGNEIDGGMLWPHGKIFKEQGKPDWDTIAGFLKAASRGVRRATPEGKHIRIVVHTATGGNIVRSATYHRELRQREVDYDVIGLSFYPWWHGTLEELKANTTRLIQEYGKEVMVVEAAYPWKTDLGKQKGDEQHMYLPRTPEGQARFLREVIAVIHELPDEKGIGVIWWHPDSVQVEGKNVWMGGACALWKGDGSPLPALEEFQTY